MRDAGIPAEHWTRPHIFLTMLNHMKRRMEEDGTISKARKPDSDEAHLQPDAATTRADSKHGFEDFDLAPREEQLAIDVRPSLKHNEKLKEGVLDVGLSGYAPRRASMGTGVSAVQSMPKGINWVVCHQGAIGAPC